MPSEPDHVVKLKTLDGTWETCGVDRLRGVTPDQDSFELTWNDWGSDAASFTLKTDPRAYRPDLTAFTPCQVFVAGVKVWAGRVKATPANEGDDRHLAVQGEGRQYETDDDVYERIYVHSRLADWRDLRTFPTAELDVARAAAAGQVNNDKGTISLMVPVGQDWTQGAYVGVALDLGPSNLAAAVSLDYEGSANGANYKIYVRGHAAPDSLAWTSNDVVAGTSLTALGASGTLRGAIPAASRYVLIFLYNDYTGTTGTPGPIDVWFKLTGIRVFTDDAWRSTDASVLKASDVIKDVHANARGLLPASTEYITDPADPWEIESYANDGFRTLREHAEAVNAYEARQLQVDVDGHLVYRDKPTAATLEVGAWPGAQFDDASMGSGEAIRNHVVVEGSGPDGETLRIERGSRDATPVFATPQPANPSFDVNTSGWSSAAGTITRDTGVFDTSPASGRLTSSGGGAVQISADFTVTDRRPYRLVASFRREVTLVSPSRIILTHGLGAVTPQIGTTEYDTAALNALPLAAFSTIALDFVADGPTASVLLQFSGGASTILGYIDSLALYQGGTLVDRRGFRRSFILQASMGLTQALGERLGDLFLEDHKTNPFKGALTLTGQGGVRRALGGHTLHPAHIGLEIGNLIRFTDRVDPDTGAWGRKGRVAGATYRSGAMESQVDIDSQAGSLEQAMAKLALLIGN